MTMQFGMPVHFDAASARTGSDPQAEAYQKFFTEFKALLVAGNSKDADELLFRNKQFDLIFMKMKPFDALVESIMQDTTIPKRFIRAAQLCGILENQGLANDFSRFCHACCLVKVGNLIDAKAMLQQQNYRLGYAHGQIDLHKEIPGHDDLVELFTACRDFMNTSIRVDRFCEQFQKLLSDNKVLEILTLFTEHKEFFPTFKTLRSFDAAILALSEADDSEARQSALLLCGYMKKAGFDTPKIQSSYAQCIAKEHERLTPAAIHTSSAEFGLEERR